MAADTAFAAFMLSRNSPCRAAQASTENRPFTSVAVVTTGTAPSSSASRRARALAPPMCPDSRGTTNRPSSSTHSTAGSVRLSRTQGAMERTAMPAAPTNTRASAQANSGPVDRAQGAGRGVKSPPASFSGARQRHSSPGRSRQSRASRAVSRPRRV